jgi:hypothetical protein
MMTEMTDKTRGDAKEIDRLIAEGNALIGVTAGCDGAVLGGLTVEHRVQCSYCACHDECDCDCDRDLACHCGCADCEHPTDDPDTHGEVCCPWEDDQIGWCAYVDAWPDGSLAAQDEAIEFGGCWGETAVEALERWLEHER